MRLSWFHQTLCNIDEDDEAEMNEDVREKKNGEKRKKQKLDEKPGPPTHFNYDSFCANTLFQLHVAIPTTSKAQNFV